MGCISIAVLLLSLTGGMFLLAKTQKDGLNIFFKVISWFVIVLSLGAIICCGIRCVAKGCGKKKGSCHKEMMMKGGCEMGEGCEMEGDCHGKFEKKIMMRKCMMGDMEKCEGSGECEQGGMCKHGGEGMSECSMGKDGKKIVKDTLLIKK